MNLLTKITKLEKYAGPSLPSGSETFCKVTRTIISSMGNDIRARLRNVKPEPFVVKEGDKITHIEWNKAREIIETRMKSFFDNENKLRLDKLGAWKD